MCWWEQPLFQGLVDWLSECIKRHWIRGSLPWAELGMYLRSQVLGKKGHLKKGSPGRTRRVQIKDIEWGSQRQGQGPTCLEVLGNHLEQVHGCHSACPKRYALGRPRQRSELWTPESCRGDDTRLDEQGEFKATLRALVTFLSYRRGLGLGFDCSWPPHWPGALFPPPFLSPIPPHLLFKKCLKGFVSEWSYS